MRLGRTRASAGAFVPTAAMASMVLVLAFFFMLNATYETDPGRLALPETVVRLEVDRNAALVVALPGAGPGEAIIEVSDGSAPPRPVGSLDDVTSFARALTQQDACRAFVIKADRSLRYEVVDRLLESLRDGGVERISFLTAPEGSP